MAAKNAAKPRPNKNSDGQNKQPTMSRDIHISPGKPTEPPPPLGAPAPGSSNPMTHPAHPAMQSSLAGPKPGTAPAGPSDAPKDQRQVQERIQFKDLPAPAQAQAEQQQGIDPYAAVKMIQSATQQHLAQGPSSGVVPNMLSGPYVPPDVQSFPDDMAHLTTLMGQGFAPGASGQEHEFAQNAHSLARAKIDHAFSQAQDPLAQPTVLPAAPAPAAGPITPSIAPPSAAPPGVAGVPGPPMGSSMGTPPPAAPPLAGPPLTPQGAIPPAVIAGLLAKNKAKRPTG